MNTANYLKNGKYPLSTETLSFIQEQIKLLEALAGLGGKNYIIQPDSRVGGIAVITKKVKTGIIEREEREVLELLDSPTYSQQTRFVTVLTEKEYRGRRPYLHGSQNIQTCAVQRQPWSGKLPNQQLYKFHQPFSHYAGPVPDKCHSCGKNPAGACHSAGVS